MQKGTVFNKSHDNVNFQLPTYTEMPENSKEQKYETNIFKNESDVPNIPADCKEQQYENNIR